MSVERGVREAFLAFFADDGINFQPHPVRTREAFLSRPAPPVRPPVTLDWQPVFADVSRSGDLGYTTGPYTLTDNSPQHRPTRHGYYFSIWKRQADGNWKVVLDLGITTPAPSAPAPAFQAARQVKLKSSSTAPDTEAGRADLMKLEGAFLREAQTHGTTRAYSRYLSDDARLHRDEMFPLLGRKAAASFLSAKNLSMQWRPIFADVSRSGDLGYTYGSYELKTTGASNGTAARRATASGTGKATDKDKAQGSDGKGAGTAASNVERGYYVHVWKRQADGSWKVVLDTTHPLPPEQK